MLPKTLSGFLDFYFGVRAAHSNQAPPTPGVAVGGSANSDPCPCEVWSCLVMYYRSYDLYGGPVLDSWAPSSATEPSPPGRLGVIGVVLISLRRTTRGGLDMGGRRPTLGRKKRGWTPLPGEATVRNGSKWARIHHKNGSKVLGVWRPRS